MRWVGVAVLLVGVTPLRSDAQSVAGIVLERETDMPVAGAMVILVK